MVVIDHVRESNYGPPKPPAPRQRPVHRDHAGHGRRLPHRRRHPADPPLPGQQRLRQHPGHVRLRLAVLPGPWAQARGRAQKQAKPLTAEALAAVRATANTKAPPGKRQEAGIGRESVLARKVDLALLSVLRDGLLRRSEAHLLTWADVEFRNNGTALLQLHRSKTDQESEGVVLYIGKHAADALRAIRPAEQQLDLQAPVFGLSPQQIGRRVNAAAKAAGLGEGFTGHSGRVGMAQDLASTGTELPALMSAGRWKNSKMPARYTERQAAGRGAVAKYYQEGGN